MDGEKAWRLLHKNSANNFEQVLEATPNKAITVRPPSPITKNIKVRRTRHAGHRWRSRDELISDVILWTPLHGQARGRKPARIYIQQLNEDTGYSPEDLPEAMSNREEWRERVRDIRAGGTRRWRWLSTKVNLRISSGVMASQKLIAHYKVDWLIKECLQLS